MSNYRRQWVPGATYFFTVALCQRHGNALLVEHIDTLRRVVHEVRAGHPFAIHAWVVLPDHLHCVLEHTGGDTDFSMRWRLIKGGFSRRLATTELRSRSRLTRAERGIWQRRFWEHRIRDERDFAAHIDYVHINPLKHGLVQRVADWPYSTFHRWARAGAYPLDWGETP